jgi:hypothetical protein
MTICLMPGNGSKWTISSFCRLFSSNTAPHPYASAECSEHPPKHTTWMSIVHSPKCEPTNKEQMLFCNPASQLGRDLIVELHYLLKKLHQSAKESSPAPTTRSWFKKECGERRWRVLRRSNGCEPTGQPCVVPREVTESTKDSKAESKPLGMVWDQSKRWKITNNSRNRLSPAVQCGKAFDVLVVADRILLQEVFAPNNLALDISTAHTSLLLGQYVQGSFVICQ